MNPLDAGYPVASARLLSGVDCPEFLAQLRERQQPPFHLLGIRCIARPNTSL